MSSAYQLEFFKDPEISRLESEIEEAKQGTHRVRKGLFARLNELQKMYDELYEEHKVFKRAICKGGYDVDRSRRWDLDKH